MIECGRQRTGVGRAGIPVDTGRWLSHSLSFPVGLPITDGALASLRAQHPCPRGLVFGWGERQVLGHWGHQCWDR